MKNLLTLLTLLLTIHLGQAQNVSTSQQPFTNAVSHTTPAEATEIVVDKTAIKELSEHLKKNLIIPNRIRENRIHGKSFVHVHITETGSITNIEIVESFDSGMDKAITRALNKIEQVHAITFNGVSKAQIVQLPVIVK